MRIYIVGDNLEFAAPPVKGFVSEKKAATFVGDAGQVDGVNKLFVCGPVEVDAAEDNPQEPTESDQALAISLVRLFMDMEREGQQGISSVLTGQKIKQAIRDHVNTEIAKTRA